MSTLRPFRPAHTPGPPRMVPQRSLARDADAMSVASDPVLAAEAEAAAIIVAAEAERDRMVAEGYTQGLARAEADIATERATLAESLGALARARAEAASGVAESAAHLAVDLALSLVGDAIEVSPQAIEPIIARALAASPPGSQRVRIHPSLADALGHGSDMEIVSDPSLAPGDVVVETGAGETDHRLTVTRELLHDAVRVAAPEMP